jgi:hypothetical protein
VTFTVGGTVIFTVPADVKKSARSGAALLPML